MSAALHDWSTIQTEKRLFGVERRFAIRWCTSTERRADFRFMRTLERDGPEAFLLSGAMLFWLLPAGLVGTISILVSYVSGPRPTPAVAWEILAFMGFLTMMYTRYRRYAEADDRFHAELAKRGPEPERMEGAQSADPPDLPGASR